MTHIIETKRLILREFIPEDASDFYHLNQDSEVMRYTGDEPFASIAKAKLFIENYREYKAHGCGRWAVISKSDKAFLGWCGLKQHKAGYVDLGFRFFKRHWGNGYATESAQACVEYGFNTLLLKEIVGRVAPENSASVKVLEKIGMQFWKKDTCKGIPNALYYRIKKT